MKRLDYNITDRITDMSKSLGEFKSVQKSSGDSFVNYATSSTNSYDFALTTNVAHKSFRLTFTHTEPDKYNIVDLSWFVRIDDSNVMASPRVSNATPYTTEVCYEAPQLGVTTWLIDCTNLNNPASHTFYFKFYFNGTTSGTFSASVI